ncbi:uncharacterized protein [Dysidea avara]|uniref:uncharacterized protein n=1 Tax=Dysidea avara TaxID=196820 RepID=UPI00332E7BCB
MFTTKVVLCLLSLLPWLMLCTGEGLSPVNIDPSLDCDLRTLAWSYAKKLLPQYGTFLAVYDALQLQNCSVSLKSGKVYEPRPFHYDSYRESVEIFVDAKNGNDNNNGDMSHPVKSIEKALTLFRSQMVKSPTTIYLRNGTYYLQDTIVLEATDSYLTLAGYKDEAPVISGGKVYKFDWKPYTSKLYPQAKIFMTDLSQQSPSPFTQLFIGGRRAVRARYPNGNPETMGAHTNPSGYYPKAEHWYTPRTTPGTLVMIDDPNRNGTHFPYFSIGIGGSVSVFDPPESYWGTAKPTGGSTYTIPIGMQYPADVDFVNRTWSDPSTGELHTFQGHRWGGWVFQIDKRDESNHNFTWSKGGFQEARGAQSGAEWFVDNIFEELDSPGEWYCDSDHMILYFVQNGTSLPDEGVGPVLDQLIAVMGSQDKPVTNITIANLVFAHSATTYMSSYEVPSGGDWSVHRGGAVFVEGAEHVLVQNCRFDSPGGNGVFLSNYVRDAVIEENEFVWVGDNAIVAVGTAELIDGTNGNQPRGTQVIGNLVHEIGIYGKQVCAYVQSVACQTQLIGNVFFNGPRAGVNLNDGFGGGNLLKNNLIFNMVRETGDHGPFNSWDRQPYLTKVCSGNGSSSLTPAENHITNNFFINNYHATFPIDHDDGSCYYTDTYNFLVYGGYKNYLGHSKTATNNVYIFPGKFKLSYCANSDGASLTDIPSGWGEVWTNNTCVITSSDIYHNSGCDPSHLKGLVPFTANNQFYTANGTVSIQCGEKKTFTLQQYQALGYDIGSTVSKLPSNEEIVSWGKQLLGVL